MSDVHIFTATSANGASSEFVSNKDYLLLEEENAELKRKLEKAMSLIKKAQNIERDRVREECGNPGFDGPMTIMTWMDEMIKEIEEIK